MGTEIRVNGSSGVSVERERSTEDQLMDILSNPRKSEYAKVAELEKTIANLSEPEKKELFDRLKDHRSPDPLSRQFHYRLSHHADRPGKLSTVDQVLQALKTPPQNAPAPEPETSTVASKGSSPAMMDSKMADALVRDRFVGAPPIDPTVLGKGESITAKVTTDDDIMKPRVQTTFDFSRPVTKQQAAAIIFQNGKVPSAATLLQGPENKWVVQFSHSLEAKGIVASHYNSHSETVVARNRSHWDLFYPQPDVTFTWVGGPRAAESLRKDLKNDYGFVISKKYPLDEGKSPDLNVRMLVQKGHGYELKFEKPMTSDQVMDKLFDKDTAGARHVRLVPVPMEPTQTWQVQMLDGQTPFKRPASYAFHDANVYAKESVAPTIPDGIRTHIENQTVPKNATKFPPDVYVWEQEGTLVRAETNGKKGDGGYYNYETTQLNPLDKNGNDTMRYFMLEKGLPVRKAWQEYIKHWDELHTGMLGMVAGASRFMPHVSGSLPVRSSFEESSTSRTGRIGAGEPGFEVVSPKTSSAKVEVAPGAIKAGETRVSNPAPMPGPAAPGVAPNAPVPAPVQPQQKTFGHGVATENLTPAQQPAKQFFTPNNGKTLPGALYRRVGKAGAEPAEISWFPKKSGTSLSEEQVIQIHRTDSSRIGWSMTAKEHLAQWKAANPGSTESPPVAFTTKDGRAVVNEEGWVANGQPALWNMELLE